MTISVIIPAYKAADTIERALSSVAEQTLKPKQIIVIDDGSNDDTLKIVESFKERIYEIEIIIFKQQKKAKYDNDKSPLAPSAIFPAFTNPLTIIVVKK